MSSRFVQYKKGNILAENIVFIVLTLIFFTILILFISTKSSGTALIEEETAKQVALIIDSAKPGMIIKINMEDALDKAKKENYKKNIISITGNIVTAKLSEKSGYSYSFFNKVDAAAFPDTLSGIIKDYAIVIKGYK